MASQILIVEDDKSIAELLRDYLEINGMTTEMAHTGPSGLEKALAGSFDLVLLDLMLPGMDGFEVLRHIREEREIPVLLVSARREDIDKIRGLGLGADDYITKPFSPGELVARVRAHLGHGGHGRCRDGHRAHRQTAREDRGGPEEAAVHRDGVGGGIPVQGVIGSRSRSTT